MKIKVFKYAESIASIPESLSPTVQIFILEMSFSKGCKFQSAISLVIFVWSNWDFRFRNQRWWGFHSSAKTKNRKSRFFWFKNEQGVRPLKWPICSSAWKSGSSTTVLGYGVYNTYFVDSIKLNSWWFNRELHSREQFKLNWKMKNGKTIFDFSPNNVRYLKVHHENIGFRICWIYNKYSWKPISLRSDFHLENVILQKLQISICNISCYIRLIQLGFPVS